MKRWIIVSALVATLALAGCSKSEPTTSTQATSGDSPTTKAADAPTTKAGGTSSATLALNDCLAVGMANLGLISGSAADAEKLKGYNPPDEVKKAADVLVAEGGLKVTGGEQKEAVAASETITNWVDSVCPG